MLHLLSRNATLRRMGLPLLRLVGRDTTIRHHWWPQANMRLHTYRHRGYWFKGRRRERRVMELFERFVREGDTVVEVGGHIGYVTLHLRRLVGESGRVVVFEPGINNLPYLRTNVAPFSNIELVEMACGDREDTVSFWIEGLSGQNNSLNKEYRNFAENRSSAYSTEEMREVKVAMTTLDGYLAQHGLEPSLMKIDVEGAEKLVLEGAARVLRDIRPVIIIEVTENAAAVSAMLESNGYLISDRDHAEWVCEPAR